MRILRIIASFRPEHGGPIEGIKQMTHALKQKGVHSELLTLDPPSKHYLRDFEGDAHGVGPGFLKYGYTSALKKWLLSNYNRFDCAVIHGLWQYSSYGTAKALKSKLPFFVYSHGMLDPWFNRQYPLKYIKKLPYWIFFERYVLKNAKAVFFTSLAEQRLARKSFPLFKCREEVVRYGISVPMLEMEALKRRFLEQNPVLKGKKYLLFLGRITPKKGCDLLLKAFENILQKNSYYLVMAGPDSTGLRARLEKTIQNREVLKKIIWTGMMIGDDKWGAFSLAEAFILPSHQENFGISVVEALSCGKPVLISNKVNIWKEIEGARAGFVANDDLSGTESLLLKWQALTADNKESMALRAHKCFLKHFEVNQAAEDFLRIVNQYGIC